MNFYCDYSAAYKELTQRVFDMPQLSDSMQKYIACIVLGKTYSPIELVTMVRTTINRNRKWGKDDLSYTFALLILLSEVKTMFADTWVLPMSPDLICRRASDLSRIYHHLVASKNMMTVKYAHAHAPIDRGQQKINLAFNAQPDKP